MTLARTEMLERKFDKSMRAYADEMKSFRNELQILKTIPRQKTAPISKTRDQHPFSDASKKSPNNSKFTKPLKNSLAKNSASKNSDKVTGKNMVSEWKEKVSVKFLSHKYHFTEFATSSMR